MDYILTGKPISVRKVLETCNHLVRRGDIRFIPVEQVSVNAHIADDKYVIGTSDDIGAVPDSKAPRMATDEKAPKSPKKSN
jgi:hypothetical protein|nr:MAG TPA: Protein of unknown function (DUF1382) [Caudoviricetes sp.]